MPPLPPPLPRIAPAAATAPPVADEPEEGFKDCAPAQTQPVRSADDACAPPRIGVRQLNLDCRER